MPSKSTWTLFVGIAAYMAQFFIGVPERWKPIAAFITLCFLLLASTGWLFSHVTFLQRLRPRTKPFQIMTIVVVGAIGATSFILLWLWARPSATTSERFDQMTNVELREAALTFVKRLRRFSGESQRIDRQEEDKDRARMRGFKLPEMREAADKEWSAQVERRLSRSQKFTESFKANFMVDANLIAQALKRKVDGIALVDGSVVNRPYPIRSYHEEALNGKWITKRSLDDLADYLESLYKQLPVEDVNR